MKVRSVVPVVVALATIAAVMSVSLAQQSSSGKQVADEIMSLARAQWAAMAQKNVVEAGKNVADDYTEFNPDFSTRLEGKAIYARLAEAETKGTTITLVSEMANPRVQVYGDVAILSYNYVGMTQDKDGKTQPTRAKSTRVYAKQGGKWMLVHANFAADPLPN